MKPNLSKMNCGGVRPMDAHSGRWQVRDARIDLWCDDWAAASRLQRHFDQPLSEAWQLEEAVLWLPDRETPYAGWRRSSSSSQMLIRLSTDIS